MRLALMACPLRCWRIGRRCLQTRSTCTLTSARTSGRPSPGTTCSLGPRSRRKRTKKVGALPLPLSLHWLRCPAAPLLTLTCHLHPHLAAEMSTGQLMVKGRKDITDIDNTLARAERIVEDTDQVAVQVSVCECARMHMHGTHARGKGLTHSFHTALLPSSRTCA